MGHQGRAGQAGQAGRAGLPGRTTVAAVVVAIALLVGACSRGAGSAGSPTTTAGPTATTTTTEAPVEAGDLRPIYRPRVADCFDRRPVDQPGAPAKVPVVLLLDCALPHQFEVFAVVDAPVGGPAYPGEAPLRAHARASCVRAFEGYVGQAYEVSRLEIDHHLPSPTEWGEGVRQLACAVYDLDASRVAGSLRGAAR